MRLNAACGLAISYDDAAQTLDWTGRAVSCHLPRAETLECSQFLPSLKGRGQAQGTAAFPDGHLF